MVVLTPKEGVFCLSSKRVVVKVSLIVEILMFSFRLLFYLVAFMDLWSEKDTIEHFIFVLTWFLLVIFIPMGFWVPMLYKKSTYYWIAELLLNGSFTIYVMMTSDHYVGVFLISIMTIAFHLEKRQFWMLPFLFFFPFINLILTGIVPSKDPYFFIFNHWLFLFFGLGLNLIIKAYHKTDVLNQIIEEKNQTLIQYAKQIETLTVVEERNRMARDLHDTLGHSFISYILGLDAVMYLMDSDPSQAKKKIEELRHYASENLDQIRETIHEIGTEPDMTVTKSFSALIEEFSAYTHTKVELHVNGEEYVLNHSIRMALLRCLQESLTNAKRHGQAKVVSINLSFQEDGVELSIQDDGVGTDHLQYGFGLNSMKERLGSLNGKLQLDSSKGLGTKVICQIPFRGL
jgi:signal transduction histidine kinase